MAAREPLFDVTARHPHSRLARPLGRFLVFCLLYQSLLAVAAVPLPADSAGGTPTMMCTQHGLKAMLMPDGAGDPAGDADEPGLQASCAFCVMGQLMHGAAPPPVAPWTGAPAFAEAWEGAAGLVGSRAEPAHLRPIRGPPAAR